MSVNSLNDETDIARMPVNIPFLVEELNRAIEAHGTGPFTSSLLTKIAELFLAHSKRGLLPFDDFDEVFSKIVQRIETRARAELSEQISGLPAAPLHTSRCMALDDEIEVAQPVLEKVAALDTETLLNVANLKGQAHLLAITRRTDLDEAITQVVIQRGEREIILSLIRNSTARISTSGFDNLIGRSANDSQLAVSLLRRPDFAPAQCLSLLTLASIAVRLILERENHGLSQVILEAVTNCAGYVLRELHPDTIDYSRPLEEMRKLQAAGRLGEQNIRILTANGYIIEMIAALATLSNSSAQVVEAAFSHERPDGILILGKATRLSWSCVRGILSIRGSENRLSDAEFEYCEEIYTGLHRWAARAALTRATVERHSKVA
jgi:hypothetical protein